MHGCNVRPVRGRAGLAARCASAGFALVLVAAVRGAVELRVPLPQVLVEAEQAIAARLPGDAAELLDLVLARAAGGEPLPAGLAIDRVRLAAATAHFQSGGYGRAQDVAETLIASRPAPAPLAEARMILGLALALQEKFGSAVAVFAELEGSPEHRDRARLYRAMAARQAGDLDVAVEAYSALLASAPRDAEWADAALVLVSLHLERKETAEASRGLALLQGQRNLVDNLAGLNALCLQLGDALLEAEDPEAALAAYRLASSRDDLKRDQAARHARMADYLDRARRRAQLPAAELDALRRLEARAETAKAALAAIEDAEDYDAALHLRLGTAFLEAGAPWEAALAFGEVLAAPAEIEGRSRAWAGLVRAFSESGRLDRAEAAWERFAAEPGSPDAVLGALFQLVQAAQFRGDSVRTLRLLERSESLPGPEGMHEPLRLLHAQSLLVAGRLDEARARATDILRRFPAGRFREDASYLHAMAGMMAGRQERAVAEIGAYLEAYPEGRYEADARYRLAAAHQAMENPEQAAELAAAWLAGYPDDHPQRGEVLVLRADALASLGDVEAALAGYRSALNLPLADELLGYVLDEATKHYQSRREYAEAVALWETFAAERPDHPFTLNAAWWIGQLHLRSGRADLATSRVAEMASRHLADPARDGVERLLLELVGLVARPPRGRSMPAEDSPAADGEAWAARFAGLLGVDLAGATPTERARVFFAVAEACGLRGDGQARGVWLDRIAREIAPVDLPPGILGRVGDRHLEAGRREEARSCYERILERYASSVFADFGYTGLGEIALAEGRAAEALVRFDEAIDRAGARFKLREVSLGRARALLALERWTEAREAFEAVAGNRQWRGEATAESVYSLGEILRRQGGRENLAQAQAYFQRVYLSYRKHPVWVVRAYLRSAETFAALDRPAEAAATLRELLRDERLSALPEAEAARGRVLDYEARVPAATPEERA
jgi:tetratricopeptide (TPR) repeat protein